MTKEELQLKYNEYTYEIEDIKGKINELKEKEDDLFRKRCDINKELDILIADEWRKEAAEGKHKIVWYRLMPSNIHYEWKQMEEKISGGCTGDWYDGCRGCEKRCSQRAKEQFMRKYNIKEIKYGDPEIRGEF